MHGVHQMVGSSATSLPSPSKSSDCPLKHAIKYDLSTTPHAAVSATNSFKEPLTVWISSDGSLSRAFSKCSIIVSLQALAELEYRRDCMSGSFRTCLSQPSNGALTGSPATLGGLLSSSKIKIKICNLRLIWVYIDLIKRCYQGATSKFTSELPLGAK